MMMMMMPKNENLNYSKFLEECSVPFFLLGHCLPACSTFEKACTMVLLILSQSEAKQGDKSCNFEKKMWREVPKRLF